MLKRVMYASEVTRGVTPEEVSRLVGAAQQRNRRLDITGVLLRCDHNFVQVLEGKASNVSSMMESIHADRRHYNMRLFIEERTTTRMFDAFSMGFVIRLDMLQSLEHLRSGGMEPQAFLELLLRVTKDEAPYPMQ